MTSILVAVPDKVPQNIDGINRGSRRGWWWGCASWQMKRLLDFEFTFGFISYFFSHGCQPEWRLRGWLCGSRDRQRYSFGGRGVGHRQTLALGHCCAQTHHSINRIQVKFKFKRPFFRQPFPFGSGRTSKLKMFENHSAKYSTRFFAGFSRSAKLFP